MIIIRETLVAKPGNASKLAKLMKEVMAEGPRGKVKIMTDVTGKFNQVVMETEMESLADFEKDMQEYMQSQSNEMREKMKGYQDMYLTGKREIYRVW